MNEIVIKEIGKLLRVNVKLSFSGFEKASVNDIISSYEYAQFKESYPELCRLAEGGGA